MATRSRRSILSHEAEQETSSIRVQIDISPQYSQEPILHHLIAAHSLSCVIISANLRPGEWGLIELDLNGTPEQIRSGMDYLSNLDVIIKGKSTYPSDGWY